MNFWTSKRMQVAALMLILPAAPLAEAAAQLQDPGVSLRLPDAQLRPGMVTAWETRADSPPHLARRYHVDSLGRVTLVEFPATASTPAITSRYAYGDHGMVLCETWTGDSLEHVRKWMRECDRDGHPLLELLLHSVKDDRPCGMEWPEGVPPAPGWAPERVIHHLPSEGHASRRRSLHCSPYGPETLWTTTKRNPKGNKVRITETLVNQKGTTVHVQRVHANRHRLRTVSREKGRLLGCRVSCTRIRDTGEGEETHEQWEARRTLWARHGVFRRICTYQDGLLVREDCQSRRLAPPGGEATFPVATYQHPSLAGVAPPGE